MQHLAWDGVKKEIIHDKFWRKYVTGEKAMVAQLGLSKDCVVPLHHHESEQISVVMRAGEVLVIPSHLPHSALALEDSSVIEVFSPIRHDWLSGTDDYLRK